MAEKIRLGISSCLLGHKVRYDGGHQHDRYITDTLGQYVDFVPVCPEVECGLPVPRQTLRLVGEPQHPRLKFSRSGEDITEKMQTWAEKRLAELEKEELDGFIFKRMSPSSGMERVKVYSETGMPNPLGVGIFARAFMDRFPRLPVEEDGRLNDPKLRENFVERIFVHRRWRDLFRNNKTTGGLVSFHTAHKLQLLAHSEAEYRDMGRLVAKGATLPADMLFDRYEALLMSALRKKTTIKKHTNVLLHIFGYFKKVLPQEDKSHSLEILDQYYKGYVPLIVPLTLLKFFVKKFDQTYLAGQTYLDPHPLELQLLNHA